MVPTLQQNELLLVNKAVYWHVGDTSPFAFLARGADTGTGGHYLFRPPRRGEIVVFEAPLDPGRDYIKRVIGVPGDTVSIHDGGVWVNGKKLSEPYINGAPTMVWGQSRWTVPPGNFFVLGDNRTGSSDSREWGFVPLQNMIGKATFTYWPVSLWGTVGWLSPSLIPTGLFQPAST